MCKKQKKFSFGRLMMSAALTVGIINSGSALTFDSCGGWLETAYAVWQPVDGAVRYEVSFSGEGVTDKLIDEQLVRRYPYGIRADVPGLSKGSYTLTVAAIDASGRVVDRGETATVDVLPHNREGFAFTGGNIPGAYSADGVLKENARVLYVSANTVNTVTCDVADKKGKLTSYTGLAQILNAYGKGYDKTPLAIRVIGAVSDTEFSGLKDGNYINLQGSNNTDRLLENVTLEGIGVDATLYGYGVCFKRTHNVEVRNLGIMLFGDDAISMDTDNTNIWVHNIDFFYGKPGSDKDQVKGDGSIDMKYNSSLVTISYNHFFDSGKVMGCGGTTGEKQTLKITFHHNWFDHADSRCPRLHYTTAHVYNNYYDGVPVYCIGNTTESSAFVENNYFRNCKRPMMISGQGTDSYNEATGAYDLKGTFSGQAGGMMKAYNNVFVENTPKLVYHTQHATHFDAYLASSRDEQLPSSVVSVKGAWPYSNFDTAPDMYASIPAAPEDVPADVTAYAGRMDGGDFKWSFDNAKDDEDHEVNLPLKAAITGYASRLQAIQGEDDFTTGITDVWADDETEIEVYDLHGRKVGNDFTALPCGIYLLKHGGHVEKRIIR